jgi:hypothetical protein
LTAELPRHQPAAQSAPCTTIADDAERLACYDRALRSPAPEPATPARAAEARVISPEPTPVAPAPAAQAPAAGAEPSAPEPAAATSPREAEPAAAPEPQRGADKQPVAIVIVGVRTLPGRESAFTAQDGTTWVQTDGLRLVGLPAAPFDAELKSGAMGSTFLVPKDGPRAIRVRRATR